jgi:hypothetical protein
MGRYAQQRKRGGHVGQDGGLPPGPSLDLFSVEIDGPVINLSFTSEDPAPFDFWRSRWRRPALSMLWTFAADDPQPTETNASQESPFGPVGGQQQDYEVAYCGVGGNLLSQWSAFGVLVP